MEWDYRTILKRHGAGPHSKGDNSAVYTDRGEVLAVDSYRMTATAVISTTREDRSKDIVEPSGLVLANYSGNPVVMWEHGKRDISTPVGTSRDPDTNDVSISISDDRVIAKCWFSTSTKEAANIAALVMEGVVCGTSVQMLPIVCKARTAQIPGRSRPGLHITEWDLLEWSWVAIPDNPNALRMPGCSRSQEEQIERVREVVSRGRIGGERLHPLIAKSLSSCLIETPTLFKGVSMKDDEDDDRDLDEEEVDDDTETDEDDAPPEEDDDDDDDASLFDDDGDYADEDGDEDAEDGATPDVGELKHSAQMLLSVLSGVDALEQYINSETKRLDNDRVREDVLPGVLGKIGELKADVTAALGEIHPDVPVDSYEPDEEAIAKSFAFCGVNRGGIDRATRNLRQLATQLDLQPGQAGLLGGTIAALEAAAEQTYENEPVVKTLGNDSVVSELRDELEIKDAEIADRDLKIAKLVRSLEALKSKLAR